MELFGESLAIADFPNRPDIVGIGLSDWDIYANRLREKLNYTNTYYHKKPYLDITSVEQSEFGRYDFIISSDVFEHIAQPVSRAFENARRLLKAGGFMIFSTPYLSGKTREHFPELWRYAIQREGRGWVLVNETVDGRRQRFTGLTFHGGPGTVIEMRLFGKESLLKETTDAGFSQIAIYEEDVEKFGIVWNPYVPENAPYRPLIYGLGSPPWAVRNDGRTKEIVC